MLKTQAKGCHELREPVRLQFTWAKHQHHSLQEKTVLTDTLIGNFTTQEPPLTSSDNAIGMNPMLCFEFL